MSKPNRTQSSKSVRSFKSVKSMFGSEGSERSLDFDELVAVGCLKFNCPYRTVVKKDYHLDEFLKSMKSTTPKPKRMSAAAFSKMFDLPETQKDTKTDVTETRTITSENNDTIVITAIYDKMSKFCEILLNKQKNLPRVIIQILGLIAPNFTQLKNMSIKRCNIDGYTISEMSKFLPLTSITEICLDDSPLAESSYVLLLNEPCRISSLSLCRCNIRDDVCEQIASKLHFLESAEPTLTVLNLSSNHITNVGAKSIGEALRTNRHLRYLNLADNRIGDDGADRILHALIDFPLTYDEIVRKRRMRFGFLNAKREVYLRCLQNWDTKSLDSIFSKKPTLKKDLKTKLEKIKPTTINTTEYLHARAEMMAIETVGEFWDPYSSDTLKFIDGYSYCSGNMVLCYLNLSYNKLSYFSIKKLRSILLYQTGNKKFDETGLLKVVIDGNPGPDACGELQHIAYMLNKNVVQNSPKYLIGQDRRKSRAARMSINVPERSIQTLK